MDFFTAVDRRRSVRAYQPRDVEGEKLERILEAANRAPSAGNLQAYEILVVKDPEVRRALAKGALDQGFVAQAPVVLVFLRNGGRASARYGRRGERLYALQDATIACAYAQLAATALGLASCWVGAFGEAAVARALKAPRGLVPVALLPLGYAAEKVPASSRRRLVDLARYETF